MKGSTAIQAIAKCENLISKFKLQGRQHRRHYPQHYPQQFTALSGSECVKASVGPIAGRLICAISFVSSAISTIFNLPCLWSYALSSASCSVRHVSFLTVSKKRLLYLLEQLPTTNYLFTITCTLNSNYFSMIKQPTNLSFVGRQTKVPSSSGTVNDTRATTWSTLQQCQTPISDLLDCLSEVQQKMKKRKITFNQVTATILLALKLAVYSKRSARQSSGSIFCCF